MKSKKLTSKKVKKMSSYKLTYFNFKGRGQVIRLIFDYANQPFDENIIDRSKWLDFKADQIFKRVPVLEVNLVIT